MVRAVSSCAGKACFITSDMQPFRPSTWQSSYFLISDTREYFLSLPVCQPTRHPLPPWPRRPAKNKTLAPHATPKHQATIGPAAQFVSRG